MAEGSSSSSSTDSIRSESDSDRANRKSRPMKALGIAAAGVLAGFIVGTLGRGLQPAAPTPLPTVGRLQVLGLPAVARDLDGIQSFVIELSGVDDYGRVYLNNYLVADRELGPEDITNGSGMSKESLKPFLRALTPRGNFGLGPFEGKMFLVRGRNYIVAELENSDQGPCSAQLNIKVNDVSPIGFPVIMGEGFDAERGVTLNSNVRKRLERYGPWWLQYASCSRRIFEFELK
jgi:hypothetical protein